jgi:hypothetical protein
MADNEPEELHLPEILVLERLDGPTLEWFHGQRRAIAVARGEPVPRDVGETRRWLGERPEAVPVAPSGEGVWIPLLHRYLGGIASETLEQALIDAGAITAVGFSRGGERDTRADRSG